MCEGASMTTEEKFLALEIDSWLFELAEGKWAGLEHRTEADEQQRAGRTEAGQPDVQEPAARPKRTRVAPRGIHRFL